MIKDKQITLQKAMKAAQEGDAEEASYLFRLHSRMKIDLPKRTVERTESSKKTDDVQAPTVKITSEDSASKDLESNEKPIVENGITFMPGMRKTLYMT